MKRVDMEALRRAIAMPRASDPLRDQQIASMLEEREWLEVAEFAAYCCQTEALNLRPWQPPPCRREAGRRFRARWSRGGVGAAQAAHCERLVGIRAESGRRPALR
jgi:hypothetical protein